MAYAPEDPIGVAAETVSLILIVTSFLVVTYLTYRTRSRKSFQFEMFLFTVILVAAEIPRTIYSLQIIDLDALSPWGLAIHSVSMLILALFVAFRVNSFFSQGKERGKDFSGVVQGAVESGISSSIGLSGMKSVNFYVGSEVALQDPRSYTRSLDKLFGSGSKVLMESIIKSVCEATHIEVQPGQTLSATIDSGRQKFLATGTPMKA